MKKYVALLALFAVILLSGGCGSGGGGNSTPENNTPDNPGYEQQIPEPENPYDPVQEPEQPKQPEQQEQPEEPVKDPDPIPENIEPTPENNEPTHEHTERERTVEDIIADKNDIVDNPTWIELSSYAAINSTISSDLITLAQSRPEITAENHPRWKGFIWGEGIDMFDWLDDGQMTDTLDAVQLFAEWGFNATRIMWGFYTTKFFSDLEASKVNIKALKYLDRIIEVAIKNDMHLDFTFTNWPGFWNSLWGDYEGIPEGYEPYKSYGEFDLWINPAKKNRCVEILKMIAQRYKDVPNRNFSIYIMFEPGNNNRSTGLTVPESVTLETIGETLDLFVGSVRDVDPDRLIIFEADGDTSFYDPFENQFSPETLPNKKKIQSYVKKYDNLIWHYNFCCNPVAFHGMNANANGESEYQNIDSNNTTSSVPEYPVTFYGIPAYTNNETPATKISGFMPDNTKIRISVVNAWGGQIVVKADSEVIYEETLPNDTDYNYTEERIGFLTTFQRSEKIIEVNIPSGTTELTINCGNDGAYNIGGLEFIYPESYSVKKWYYKTYFSAYMEGDQSNEGIFEKPVHIIQIPISYNHINLDYTDDTEFGLRAPIIELNSDMTFTTNYPIARYDRDWMMQAGDKLYGVNDNNNVSIRIECANFQSAEWGEMTRYYTDFYDMCEKYGCKRPHA